MSLRIGLFGGTFDPVHNGHLSIAESFLDSGFIDKLWVLLTPLPPHKKNEKQASYEHRYRMLEAAFGDFKNTEISTIENDLPKPSYSIQTIRYLKKKYPNDTFYYCMGEDSLAQFHTWKYYGEILQECELLVAKRPGVSHDGVEKKILERTHFVDHNPLNLSSSELKELISSGKPIKDFVPANVSKIIDKEQLYS